MTIESVLSHFPPSDSNLPTLLHWWLAPGEKLNKAQNCHHGSPSPKKALQYTSLEVVHRVTWLWGGHETSRWFQNYTWLHRFWHETKSQTHKKNGPNPSKKKLNPVFLASFRKIWQQRILWQKQSHLTGQRGPQRLQSWKSLDNHSPIQQTSFQRVAFFHHDVFMGFWHIAEILDIIMYNNHFTCINCNALQHFTAITLIKKGCVVVSIRCHVIRQICEVPTLVTSTCPWPSTTTTSYSNRHLWPIYPCDLENSRSSNIFHVRSSATRCLVSNSLNNGYLKRTGAFTILNYLQ